MAMGLWTRDLAYAASVDAANRSMRKAGRKRWSEEDRDIAASEFSRLRPLEAEYPWMTPEQVAEIRAKHGG